MTNTPTPGPEEGVELTMSEIGRRGGQVTAARYDHAHFVSAGKKGAERFKALLALGKRLEKEERDGGD